LCVHQSLFDEDPAKTVTQQDKRTTGILSNHMSAVEIESPRYMPIHTVILVIRRFSSNCVASGARRTFPPKPGLGS
jgi:hypothetical protein